jgi:hypothetical protein
MAHQERGLFGPHYILKETRGSGDGADTNLKTEVIKDDRNAS